MSLENVQLTGLMVAELYGKHLLEGEVLKGVEGAARDGFRANTMKQEAEGRPENTLAPAVLEERGVQTDAESPSEPLQWLGNNAKRFVIVVNYANELHLPDAQLEFLGNILKACQLNLGDVAIVNNHKQAVSLATLTALQPANLLLFGTSLPEIGQLADFTINPVNNLQVLSSPALEQLNQPNDIAKQLKGKLWTGLKGLLKI